MACYRGRQRQGCGFSPRCFLLAAWLPFNLGTRPEAYVALGVTAVLALALRVTSRAGLGLLALVVGLTIPMSPNGLLVIAPILVCAARLVAALGATGRRRLEVIADVALLCCVAAIGITVVFADQTWDGVATATDWHTYFGPSIPWYHEADRYAYLLEHSQQGSAVKASTGAAVDRAIAGRRAADDTTPGSRRDSVERSSDSAPW